VASYSPAVALARGRLVRADAQADAVGVPGKPDHREWAVRVQAGFLQQPISGEPECQ